MEIQDCCGTTCDKLVAIQEYTELKELLTKLVAAYDLSQADRLFTSLEGHKLMHTLIKTYKKGQEHELSIRKE